MIDGQGVPFVYRGKILNDYGTLDGRRLGAFIRLHAIARRVLQSQNEGWPEPNRIEARKELNSAYDRFINLYGPINKTTLSETKDGTVIRRMPNLALFRRITASLRPEEEP